MKRVSLATAFFLLEICLFTSDYCHAQGGAQPKPKPGQPVKVQPQPAPPKSQPILPKTQPTPAQPNTSVPKTAAVPTTTTTAKTALPATATPTTTAATVGNSASKAATSAQSAQKPAQQPALQPAQQQQDLPHIRAGDTPTLMVDRIPAGATTKFKFNNTIQNAFLEIVGPPPTKVGKFQVPGNPNGDAEFSNGKKKIDVKVGDVTFELKGVEQSSVEGLNLYVRLGNAQNAEIKKTPFFGVLTIPTKATLDLSKAGRWNVTSLNGTAGFSLGIPLNLTLMTDNGKNVNEYSGYAPIKNTAEISSSKTGVFTQITTDGNPVFQSALSERWTGFTGGSYAGLFISQDAGKTAVPNDSQFGASTIVKNAIVKFVKDTGKNGIQELKNSEYIQDWICTYTPKGDTSQYAVSASGFRTRLTLIPEQNPNPKSSAYYRLCLKVELKGMDLQDPGQKNNPARSAGKVTSGIVPQNNNNQEYVIYGTMRPNGTLDSWVKLQ